MEYEREVHDMAAKIISCRDHRIEQRAIDDLWIALMRLELEQTPKTQVKLIHYLRECGFPERFIERAAEELAPLVKPYTRRDREDSD